MSTPAGDGDNRAPEPTPHSIPPVTPATNSGVTASSPAEPTVIQEDHPQTTVAQPVRVEPTRDTVVSRQKERFGGIKGGSAFFGWLTATGMAVLLLALLAAAGIGFGLAGDVNTDQAVAEANAASDTAKTVGLVGGIVLLVVLFVSYFCGGYVAGRMARFNGAKQGLAVWLWGIVMALVIAAITAIAGTKFNIFAQLNLPRLPVNEGAVTATAIIAIAAAVLAALVGALLGGQVGMRYHRRVDAAGFRDDDDATVQ